MSILFKSQTITFRFLFHCFRGILRTPTNLFSLEFNHLILGSLFSTFLFLPGVFFSFLVSASASASATAVWWWRRLFLLSSSFTGMSSSAASELPHSGNGNGNLFAFSVSNSGNNKPLDLEVDYVEKCPKGRYVRVNIVNFFFPFRNSLNYIDFLFLNTY